MIVKFIPAPKIDTHYVTNLAYFKIRDEAIEPKSQYNTLRSMRRLVSEKVIRIVTRQPSAVDGTYPGCNVIVNTHITETDHEFLQWFDGKPWCKMLSHAESQAEIDAEQARKDAAIQALRARLTPLAHPAPVVVTTPAGAAAVGNTAGSSAGNTMPAPASAVAPSMTPEAIKAALDEAFQNTFAAQMRAIEESRRQAEEEKARIQAEVERERAERLRFQTEAEWEKAERLRIQNAYKASTDAAKPTVAMALMEGLKQTNEALGALIKHTEEERKKAVEEDTKTTGKRKEREEDTKTTGKREEDAAEESKDDSDDEGMFMKIRKWVRRTNVFNHYIPKKDD